TDAFHSSHVKKIVFTAKQVPDNTTDQDLIKEYTPGQSLFFKAFFDNTLGDLAKKHSFNSARVFFKYFIDGEKIAEGGAKEIDLGSDKGKNAISLTGQLMTNKKEETANINTTFSDMLIKNANKWKTEHKLKVEAWIYSLSNNVGELLAEGELTMQPGSIDKN